MNVELILYWRRAAVRERARAMLSSHRARVHGLRAQLYEEAADRLEAERAIQQHQEAT